MIPSYPGQPPPRLFLASNLGVSLFGGPCQKICFANFPWSFHSKPPKRVPAPEKTDPSVDSALSDAGLAHAQRRFPVSARAPWQRSAKGVQRSIRRWRETGVFFWEPPEIKKKMDSSPPPPQKERKKENNTNTAHGSFIYIYICWGGRGGGI